MKRKYSDYLPLYKLLLLSLITFGFYNIFWVYRTWNVIKKANFDVKKDYTIEECDVNENNDTKFSGRFSPLLRTLGLFIPFFNIYILYVLFKHTVSYLDMKKIKNASIPGFYTFFIVCTMLTGTVIWWVGLINVVPLIMLQMLINQAHEEYDKRPIKKSLYVYEWVILSIGGIISFFVLKEFYTLFY